MSYSAPVFISETALKTLVFAVTFDCQNLCLLITKRNGKEKKKDKSLSVLLITLLARQATLGWETGRWRGCCHQPHSVQGLVCDRGSVWDHVYFSRSPVPLGLASLTHQDFLKNCQSSSNALLILWLATSFAWSGWCPFRSCPAGHLFLFFRLFIASVSSMKSPDKNRNVWVLNKIWANVHIIQSTEPAIWTGSSVCIHFHSFAFFMVKRLFGGKECLFDLFR